MRYRNVNGTLRLPVDHIVRPLEHDVNTRVQIRPWVSGCSRYHGLSPNFQNPCPCKERMSIPVFPVREPENWLSYSVADPMPYGQEYSWATVLN